MKGIDSLAPYIKPYAPGVSNPAMLRAAIQAAMVFCERTRLWRYSDVFPTIGDAVETISPPLGSIVFEIESVFLGSNKLEPVDIPWLDSNYADWRTAAISSQSRYFTQAEPSTIMLVPPATGDVRVNMFLKPSEDAVNLPDWMVDNHSKVIAEGALAELLMIPNQSFTNPDLAAAYGGIFERKLRSLSSLWIKGQQRAPMVTKPMFF